MTDLVLVELEPGRWRIKRPASPPIARSSLPMPSVISDAMPPTEQVDGRFYESKAAFRAVGRALGLTEVGNEKPKLKTTRASKEPVARKMRRESVGRAIARYKAGERVRR